MSRQSSKWECAASGSVQLPRCGSQGADQWKPGLGFTRRMGVKIRRVNEGWISLSRLPGEECEARKGLIAWKSELNIRSGRVGLREWEGWGAGSGAARVSQSSLRLRNSLWDGRWWGLSMVCVMSRELVKGIGGEEVKKQPVQPGPSMWM